MSRYQTPIVKVEPLAPQHPLSSSFQKGGGDEQWKARAPQIPF